MEQKNYRRDTINDVVSFIVEEWHKLIYGNEVEIEISDTGGVFPDIETTRQVLELLQNEGGGVLSYKMGPPQVHYAEHDRSHAAYTVVTFSISLYGGLGAFLQTVDQIADRKEQTYRFGFNSRLCIILINGKKFHQYRDGSDISKILIALRSKAENRYVDISNLGIPNISSVFDDAKLKKPLRDIFFRNVTNKGFYFSPVATSSTISKLGISTEKVDELLRRQIGD